MGLIKKLEVGEFAHFSPGTGIGWRLVEDSDDPRKRKWELVNTNTGKVLRTKTGSLSIGGNLIEWIKGGIRNTIEMQQAAEERNKAYFEEKSKTHYQVSNRRGYKRWVPKTQLMLEAEARNNNQVIEENDDQVIEEGDNTYAYGHPFEINSYIQHFTQAIENPAINDMTRYNLLQGKYTFENSFKFDNDNSYITSIPWKDMNFNEDTFNTSDLYGTQIRAAYNNNTITNNNDSSVVKDDDDETLDKNNKIETNEIEETGLNPRNPREYAQAVKEGKWKQMSNWQRQQAETFARGWPGREADIRRARSTFDNNQLFERNRKDTDLLNKQKP